MPIGQKHTLFNSAEVLALLEAHPCVKIYLSGHRHEGGDFTNGDVHYIGLEAMVESPGFGGWADVILTPKTVEIQGSGNVHAGTWALK